MNVLEVLVSFLRYLGELNCPYPFTDRAAVTDWLLGYAVRLEYGDDGRLKTPS